MHSNNTECGLQIDKLSADEIWELSLTVGALQPSVLSGTHRGRESERKDMKVKKIERPRENTSIIPDMRDILYW